MLVLLVASGGSLLLYHEHNSSENRLRRDFDAQKEQLQKQVDEQTKRAESLKKVVQHLEMSQRVADVMVTSQTESAGILRTSLLFIEYGKDNVPLPGKEFVIEGKRAHIDSLVIKFDGKFVEENDPLRGHSVALFTNLYDQKHSPDDAYVIDEPGQVPAIYKSTDPAVSQFEQELWTNFWKLADDPAYRQSMGVRVAQGEGVFRDFEPGWIYTVTVDSNGGINIVPEKLKPIVQQALEHSLNHKSPTSAATSQP